MALPANFLDELRARTPLQGLIGRSVRLVRSGRESKGCCPFHGEKTPSFYVYDDHFHCFGCGEHGDAITFVMKSQGASFMDAVESLAAEAGMEVPKASQAEAEKEARRASIHEVLQAAAQVYQGWLFSPEGSAALGYLRQRGLADETVKKFGLGWSGEGRGVLAAALGRQGIKPEQLIEAGLMKLGDYGPVDMFFSRVMFPIQDRRGAITSFSGRILGDGQPKYVNGPETAVFSKRRSLYGVNFAREAVRKGSPVIIVEGQMDVIALAQAGFGGAVAPLGTALTDDQLAEIWRISEMPYLCFDADKAGRAATLKAAQLVLPQLSPERSIYFVRMADGDDPDSTVRKTGASGFSALLAAAQPMSEALFDLVAEGADRVTAEGKAAYREKMLSAARLIQYKSLRLELEKLIWNRLSGRGKTVVNGSRIIRTPIEVGKSDTERGRIMTAIIVKYPTLLADLEEAFMAIDGLSPDCVKLRDAMSSYVPDPNYPAADAMMRHLTSLGLDSAAKQLISMTKLPDYSARISDAVLQWWESFSLMGSNLDKLRETRDQLERQWNETNDQTINDRLIKYNLMLRAARSGEISDV